MKTIRLLNRTYNVIDRLDEFNINMPTSNGVSFFGSNPNSGSVFVQFKNGGTYIFMGVTPEVRKGLINADSVGLFVAKHIVKKFPSEKLNEIGVVPTN